LSFLFIWLKQEDVYVIVYCLYGTLIPFCVMSFLDVAEIYKNGISDVDVKEWFFLVILFVILICLAKTRRCICHSTMFVWWIDTILCLVIFVAAFTIAIAVAIAVDGTSFSFLGRER
jgi:hypothetical protein